MSDRVCDFCNGVPTCEYPCADFDSLAWLPDAIESTGPWLACSTCSFLIDAGDWSELADRALAVIGKYNESHEALVMRNRILVFHCEFREHRTGSMEPVR